MEPIVHSSRRPATTVAAARPGGAEPAHTTEADRLPAVAALEAVLPATPDARPSAMVTLRVDSDPSGGTLRLGDAVLPLPASLDRTMGTRLDLLVEKPGYEPHAVELVFTETGTKVGGLKELPRPPKPAPAVKRKRAGDDEYDWGKQIYVRPGDSQAK